MYAKIVKFRARLGVAFAAISMYFMDSNINHFAITCFNLKS